MPEMYRRKIIVVANWLLASCGSGIKRKLGASSAKRQAGAGDFRKRCQTARG